MNTQNLKYYIVDNSGRTDSAYLYLHAAMAAMSQRWAGTLRRVCDDGLLFDIAVDRDPTMREGKRRDKRESDLAFDRDALLNLPSSR